VAPAPSSAPPKIERLPDPTVSTMLAVSLNPPMFAIATIGTITSAVTIMRPCTTSVSEAPRNPPKSVYASVTAVTITMPTMYSPPNALSKKTPPATMPDEAYRVKNTRMMMLAALRSSRERSRRRFSKKLGIVIELRETSV
jgi:hypothetical protein